MSFLSWLKKEVSWSELPTFILKNVLLAIVVSGLGASLMDLLGVGISSNVADLSSLTMLQLLTGGVPDFFLEEVLFRAPLYVPIFFGWSGAVLPLMVVLSSLFGWVHGSFGNIVIQGGAGFIFCVVFLKCGGMQKKFLKGLFASTSAHTLFNGIVLTVILLQGAL